MTQSSRASSFAAARNREGRILAAAAQAIVVDPAVVDSVTVAEPVVWEALVTVVEREVAVAQANWAAAPAAAAAEAHLKELVVVAAPRGLQASAAAPAGEASAVVEDLEAVVAAGEEVEAEVEEGGADKWVSGVSYRAKSVEYRVSSEKITASSL